MSGPDLLRPVGAVLAGGASRRFGRDKAAAPVAGRPLAAWAAAALADACGPLLLVGGDEALARRLGLEPVADRRPGRGPLAGLEAALERAGAEGAPGAVVLACDLPLVPASLVGEVVDAAGDGARAVVPEASPPRGVQPLSAYYPCGALERTRALLDAEPSPSMGRFLEAVAHRLLPLERVAEHGAPDDLFLNVNTPAAAERAARLLEDRDREPTAGGRGTEAPA